jgi:cell division protein FtsB
VRSIPTDPARIAALLRLYARHILGFALLALLIHDIFGAHGLVAMRRTQNQIRDMRAQIGKLNEENTALAEHVTALKTDAHAIERIAREEMGLARPGELIYKIPDASKPQDSHGPKPKR